MKKRLMPLSFSFFLESKGQKKASYIKSAVEKEYPVLDDSIFFDYTEFTFDKKKWDLISIVDRNFYEEEKIRYEKTSFVSDVSCIASRKDFTSGKVFKTEDYDVFYDAENKQPVINLRLQNNCKAEEIYKPDADDIRNAKVIFSCEKFYEKKRFLLAAISFCLVSVFFVFQACFSAKDNAKANVPEISETVIEAKIQEEDSFFKNFLACCSLLSKENGKLRFYSETKDNFIEFKVLCSSPSKLLESLQKEDFQSVKLINVAGNEKSTNGSYECIFEIQGNARLKSNETYTDLDSAKTLEELCCKNVLLQKSKNTLSDISLKDTSANIKSFFESFSELEKENAVGISSFEVTADENEGLVLVHLCFLPAFKNPYLILPLQKEVFEPLLSVFPKMQKTYVPVKTAKVEKPKEILNEIGRVKNDDGTTTVYRRSKDGKMITERINE